MSSDRVPRRSSIVALLGLNALAACASPSAEPVVEPAPSSPAAQGPGVDTPSDSPSNSNSAATATADSGSSAIPDGGGPATGITLTIDDISITRMSGMTLVSLYAAFRNGTGRTIDTRSSFSSVFDGMTLVITAAGTGSELARQPYIYHQSPYSREGLVHPLPPGSTVQELRIPLEATIPTGVALRVQLVGTLPGSGIDTVFSSNVVEVEAH